MNRHLSHIDDLVDAYTLGALDPDEVDLVERHIETCADCRALVASSRRTADAFLIAPLQVAPPPELRGRVLARIRAEVEETRPASPDGTLGGASTEPSERLLASRPQRVLVPRSRPGLLPRLRHVLFGSEQVGRDRDDAIGARLQQLLAEPDCAVWEVRGTSDAPQAHARLVATRSGHDAVLMTMGLPPAGKGRAYQVWFLRGDKPMPNALFRVDHRGQGGSILRVPTPVLTFDTVAVTPEPEGGSPGPTGTILLAGSIS